MLWSARLTVNPDAEQKFTKSQTKGITKAGCPAVGEVKKVGNSRNFVEK